MHLWYKSKSKLSDLLVGFEGGQIQIITNYGEVFVGQVKSFTFEENNRKEFDVELEWYIEFRHGSWSSQPQVTYREVTNGQRLACLLPKRVTIRYEKYYYQGSKERIKLLTDYRETVRFFHAGDKKALKLGDDGHITGPENPLFQD